MEIPVNIAPMKQFRRPLFCVSLILCAAAGLAQSPGKLDGTTSDGTPVSVYTLSNTKGCKRKLSAMAESLLR